MEKISTWWKSHSRKRIKIYLDNKILQFCIIVTEHLSGSISFEGHLLDRDNSRLSRLWIWVRKKHFETL